ncbi:aminotransferase class I/II-fold pyridoxal phosphate-dependent enzyme [Alkalihalobacillus sp. LMS39]|uniref:DegT/DnrJ/EryC1/StrS family aminotransferase n=1 Tax=Alkalihalobacillus sp. LMS39 TaxID=2924032 RepID=UPI002436DBA7|nr:aminotransferase class I/II-fold pyridoxal phosphate-dependent enzyme [Alkalihalobacillus sp. LMS39]
MNEVDKKRIYLSSPHMSGHEQKYIQTAFETNWIAPLGPNVDEFEREIADYVGVKGAVALTSGTAAIHLALSLLNITKGDVVFCSTLTFVASANPILYQGAEPVFIDSEPETWNMSPKALEKALQEAASEGKLPKAIIVVNLYGQSAKMDEIMSLCEIYRIPLIEDAAESLGSQYKGRASGSFGYYGIFSFNGNKIITTSGGGMLVSNDNEAITRARFLATQAKEKAIHYEHVERGYNYRLSNVLAGIGRGQFEVLEQRVQAKRDVFQYYYEHLAHLPGLFFMPELEGTKSNRWLSALTIDEQLTGFSVSDLLVVMEEENIEARPVWKPLHLQPLFEGTRFYSHDKHEDIAKRLFETGICLPSGSNLCEEDLERVILCVKSFYKQNIKVG